MLDIAIIGAGPAGWERRRHYRPHAGHELRGLLDRRGSHRLAV